MGGKGSGRKAQSTLEPLPELDELTTLGWELSEPLAEEAYARSAKFDQNMHCRMVAMASKGATNLMIAKANLVHPDTYQQWIRKGKEDPEAFPHYAHLYEEVERVRAELGVQMTGRVIEAANSGLPNTWQAAMTFLERRYPDDFSRHERRTLEGEDSRPQVNILVLNDPDARAAHQQLLSRIAGDTAGTGVALGPGVRGELEAGEGRE